MSVFFPGPVRTNLGATTAATRPEALANTGYAPRRPNTNADGTPRPVVDTSLFMDPLEVASACCAAIRRNDVFIVSHPEFRDGMQARHDALMRAIPDEPVNEARKAILKHFGTLLRNPIYDGQTTPGPLDETSSR